MEMEAGPSPPSTSPLSDDQTILVRPQYAQRSRPTRTTRQTKPILEDQTFISTNGNGNGSKRSRQRRLSDDSPLKPPLLTPEVGQNGELALPGKAQRVNKREKVAFSSRLHISNGNGTMNETKVKVEVNGDLHAETEETDSKTAEIKLSKEQQQNTAAAASSLSNSSSKTKAHIEKTHSITLPLTENPQPLLASPASALTPSRKRKSFSYSDLKVELMDEDEFQDLMMSDFMDERQLRSRFGYTSKSETNSLKMNVLTIQNLFRYMNLRGNLRKAELESKLFLANWLQRDESFLLLIESLQRIRGNAYLMETETLNSLFGRVLEDFKAHMMREYTDLKRKWEGMLNIL